MRKWSIDDSAELYNINGWGLNYFSINEKGHVAVTPKTDGPSIDLKELMEELQVRDVEAPVLLRLRLFLPSPAKFLCRHPIRTGPPIGIALP